MGCLRVASGFYFHCCISMKAGFFILESPSWLNAPTFSFLVQRWVGYAFSTLQRLRIAAFKLLRVFFFFVLHQI